MNAKELKNEASNAFKDLVLKQRDELVKMVYHMKVDAWVLGEQVRGFNEELEKYAVGVKLSGVDEKEAYADIIRELKGLEEALGFEFLSENLREMIK